MLIRYCYVCMLDTFDWLDLLVLCVRLLPYLVKKLNMGLVVHLRDPVPSAAVLDLFSIKRGRVTDIAWAPTQYL